MVNTYIKAKIPWLKILVIVMFAVLIIIGVGVLIPGAAGYMISGILGGFAAVYGFFAAAPYQVVITAVLVGGVLILITQRKYFFKQKIASGAVSTAIPNLQGGLINTNPLQATPIPQNILDPSKTEVTSS